MSSDLDSSLTLFVQNDEPIVNDESIAFDSPFNDENIWIALVDSLPSFA